MVGLPVPREEMLDCESWYRMADYHYEPSRTDFPSGVVHVDMGSIPEFFTKIRFLSNKYVVISSRSDYGLHYQQEFPPYYDYQKAITMFVNPNDADWGYKDINIPARINRRRCIQSDKYSIKCYSFTEATFDKIPNNVVRWFVCNNTILDDERITNIPFGINGVDGNKTPGDQIHKISQTLLNYRPNDMYANFQFYTNERMKLFHMYQNDDFCTAERDVPFEWFLDQLATHNCCLCPSGNGWDSYRVLESIYLGCIPIIEWNKAMVFYAGLNLPIIFLRSLEGIGKELLDGIRNSKYNERSLWDLTQITVSYWKNVIEESRELLNGTP